MEKSYFFKKSRDVAIIIIFIFASLFISKYAFVAIAMESGTYKIPTDSINFGGADSVSDGYELGDTLGEVGTGDSSSDNYALHAGYWQMQESSISISSPTDLALDSMGGLSGGSSEGTMSWTVITDNSAGYAMSIASSTSPALKSLEDSLDDYTPATSDPDYEFTNPSTSSSFGFSPEGTEASPRFRDNGSACNVGNLESTGKCWDGLSTTPKIVAGSNTSNHPDGKDVTIRFRAETGADHIQTSGDYSVTIIATATTL